MTDELGARIVPPPKNPMAVARQFVAERYIEIGGVTGLRHHRGSFYRFVGNHWPEDDDDRISSELWRWLEGAVYEKEVKGEFELVPFEPNRYKVTNVLEALRAIGHIEQGVQPPAWLEEAQATSIDPGEFIPLANGILELSSRRLLPHTPEFFGQHVLPFAYDPFAPAPIGWFTFLDEVWEDDDESKATLAELFGYGLSGETSLQKMFLLVGPKRSGKGTIGRVLTGLVGKHNTAGPTLASLTQTFGLQPLIGKPLAIVSDARLGSRASTIAVERLLSISGEDTLTIDRKYRDSWTGQLPTRFLILTNELPRFSDSSGALASRFVTLILTTSFYGRENPRLTDELLEEAPGIFNWALEGLDRLRERDHFLTPTSAQEAQRHLEDLASPVGAFVRDLCAVGPALEVTTDELWAAWKEWCVEEGRDRPGTKAVFARDLRAAVPGLTSVRPRAGEDRQRGYRGISLRSQAAGPRTTPDHDGRMRTHEGSPGGQFRLNDAPGPGWSGVAPPLRPGEPLRRRRLPRGDVRRVRGRSHDRGPMERRVSRPSSVGESAGEGGRTMIRPRHKPRCATCRGRLGRSRIVVEGRWVCEVCAYELKHGPVTGATREHRPAAPPQAEMLLPPPSSPTPVGAGATKDTEGSVQ